MRLKPMVQISILALLAMLPTTIRGQAVGSTESTVIYRTFYSAALGQEKECAVYLPPGYEEMTDSVPVVYFLHGLFGSERRWAERGAREVVDSLTANGSIRPMIIAMPDGDNSFYVNSVHGNAAYEDYIMQDFIPFIEKSYRIKPGRSTRAISGVSMGGYGALMLAMRHPEFFSAASAHSAVLLPVPISQLPAKLLQSYQSQFFEAVFGNPIDESYWEAHNPVDLAVNSTAIKSVKWYFDCGTEDRYGFHRGAAILNQVMESAGIEHEYGLYPGGHGWEYVRTTLHRSMTFHSRNFE